MKTVLYTGWDKAYVPLARLTWPRMAQYAARHGIDFRVYTEPPAGFNIYWTGVCRGLELLKDGAERVVYLDVDQLVTSFEFDLAMNMTNFAHGFHAPQDWGNDAKCDDLSACCLIMHQDSIPILENIIDLEPEFRDKPFPEQAPMREVYERNRETLEPAMYVRHRKPFNCVPEEISPGNVPEPWEPGDWCAHLTMAPLEERVKLAKTWLEKNHDASISTR